MKQAALGFRVHSGWAAVVAVSLEKSAPVVLERKRVHLINTFTYTFRQPYHTAKKMPLAEARQFIAQVEKEAIHAPAPQANLAPLMSWDRASVHAQFAV